MATGGDNVPSHGFLCPSSVPDQKHEEETFTADNNDDSESSNELSAEHIWSKINGSSASASSTEHGTDTSENATNDGNNVVAAADVVAQKGKTVVLKASPSLGTFLTDFVDLNGNVKSANGPENGGGANSAAMMEEAWERLRKSYVYFNGSPVGTLAALDPTAEDLNYNQVLRFTYTSYCFYS